MSDHVTSQHFSFEQKKGQLQKMLILAAFTQSEVACIRDY